MKSRTSKAARSLLIVSVFLFAAATAAAADLVDINTADSAALQTLNGIGPSKAQAIIDYRTQNGLFASIEDIQNVSGIGPATYANIKDYITVGDSSVQNTAAQSTTTTSSDSSAQAQSSNSGSDIPALAVRITAPARATAGAGTFFSGSATTAAGATPASGVRYVWNFGDGVVAEGQRVMHTYRYPGSYVVELTAAYNYSSGLARVTVEAEQASVGLIAEDDASLTVANTASSDLDISYWSLEEGSKVFVIPDGTTVIAGKGLRFSAQVLGFAATDGAALYYPNHTLAATAAVGSGSSLHGETVELPAPAKPASVPQPASTTASTSIAAAAVLGAGATDESFGPLASAVGFGALGLGGAGFAFARSRRKSVTPPSGEEFLIEE